VRESVREHRIPTVDNKRSDRAAHRQRNALGNRCLSHVK
jgi:hypothetical protein